MLHSLTLPLTAHAFPASTGEFELEIHTDVNPEQNTSLEGLYKSGGNFCTQVGGTASRHAHAEACASLEWEMNATD